jgi:hypothetical protein
MKFPLLRQVFKTMINLNTYAMKKLFLLIFLTISASLVYGQKSIDELFEIYADRDGFTTVTIDGNLLKLAHCLGDKNSDYDNDDALPVNITEIRILAQDDDHMKVDNFYNFVINDIDLKNYDEFMRVKKTNQDIRMLVRTDGNRFKEFLLIAGGEDNAVIQIKGNMTYAEAKKFSKEAEKNHGMKITSSHNN